ncbi:hypothetical protein DF039_37235 [Burkholderia cenocepacia]|nr:hypothetical protein DF039_37235 [Burkholderia cenocepacia]
MLGVDSLEAVRSILMAILLGFLWNMDYFRLLSLRPVEVLKEGPIFIYYPSFLRLSCSLSGFLLARLLVGSSLFLFP